jgi:hypothetical protein
MTVAKVSMSNAIWTRLSSSSAKAMNGNGNGNGKINLKVNGNGKANGNGKPHALVTLSERRGDPDNSPIPHKPR